MLKNCVIKASGVNSVEYHQPVERRGQKDFIMSPSAMKLFHANPRKWIKGFVPKDTEAKTWGNLIDLLILTPNLFDKRYAIIPEKYETTELKCPSCGSVTEAKKCQKCKVERVESAVTKDWSWASDTCNAWIAAQGAKECITGQLLHEAETAVKEMMDDEDVADYVKASRPQVQVVGEWHDPATGLVVPVQCLIDAEPSADSVFCKSLGDIKTTRNAEHEAFLWDAFKRGYHIQAGFDLDMHNMATRTNPNDKFSSQGRVEWTFLVQENTAPYAVGRRMMGEDFIGIGQKAYRHILARYARCLKTGEWPGYDKRGEFTIMVPYPKMEFQAMSDAMEADQTEAAEIGDENDIPTP